MHDIGVGRSPRAAPSLGSRSWIPVLGEQGDGRAGAEDGLRVAIACGRTHGWWGGSPATGSRGTSGNRRAASKDWARCGGVQGPGVGARRPGKRHEHACPESSRREYPDRTRRHGVDFGGGQVAERRRGQGSPVRTPRRGPSTMGRGPSPARIVPSRPHRACWRKINLQRGFPAHGLPGSSPRTRVSRCVSSKPVARSRSMPPRMQGPHRRQDPRLLPAHRHRRDRPPAALHVRVF